MSTPVRLTAKERATLNALAVSLYIDAEHADERSGIVPLAITKERAQAAARLILTKVAPSSVREAQRLTKLHVQLTRDIARTRGVSLRRAAKLATEGLQPIGLLPDDLSPEAATAKANRARPAYIAQQASRKRR